jgi:uncharacterized C2H2 Zn-finger protein
LHRQKLNLWYVFLVTMAKEHTCPRCKKVFAHKGSYNRHLRRKYPCHPPDDENRTCKRCNNQVFATRQSYVRHVERRHDSRIDKLENQLDALLSELRKPKEPTTTNNTTYIQNTYNVQINSFGSENTSYITQKFMRRLISKPEEAVPELLRHIHFNPEHPENQNVRITNKKERFAQIFEGCEWQVARKADVLDKLVAKGYDMLDDCFEGSDTQGEMPMRRKQRYRRFQQGMDQANSKTRKKVEEDTEILVLNHSGNKS